MKKVISNLFISFLALIFTTSSSAQVDTLTLKSYVANVKEFHPYIQITNNKFRKSELKLRAARGSFDPKLEGNWQQKQFDGKTYYDIREAKLKSATRIGISPIAKYQNNSGTFLNSENANPNFGLIGAGIEIPLLRGLIIDENRQKFQLSKFGLEEQIFSQDSTVNAILSMALEDYVNWSQAFYALQTLDTLLHIREERYQNILNFYAGGNIAAMDTLDAFSQLQKTQRDYLEGETKLNKALYKLKNHIWDPALVSKSDSLRPESAINIVKYLQPKQIILNVAEHNYTQALAFRKKQQETRIRYQFEQFKPKLNVEIMPLSAVQENGYLPSDFQRNNFMAGVNIELPLYYRKQSSQNKIAKLELENIEYYQQINTRKIETTYQMLLQNTDLYGTQFGISQQNVRNLEIIRSLEEEKYNIGESDLIKLNLRENKLVDEQLKTLSIFQKYAQSLIEFNQLTQQLSND